MSATRASFDAVVVGGGPAGLTAALYLARARRRVLVVDAGEPRNARAAEAHGVFTRDGTPPGRLLAEARAQLGRYPEAEFRAREAISAARHGRRFDVRLSDGDCVDARRLLIACGVRDELPPIPGLAEFWGARVHACAYCHGYEERGRPLAVMSSGEAALAAAASLLALSRDIVVCTNGAPLAREHRTRIEEHGIIIVDAPLVRAEEAADAIRLHFADGVVLERAALFLRSELRLTSDIPEQLGCKLDGPARVRVDAHWETSVAGVYAAGDAAADKKFVAVAAASGAEAAMAIDGALAQEDFGGVWSGPLCAGAGARIHASTVEEPTS